jgi:hypothetical protein
MLSQGLIIFSIGEGVASTAGAYSKMISTFSGEVSWTQKIKSNVINLLSILNIRDSIVDESYAFVSVMSNISKGLMVFGAAEVWTTLTSTFRSIVSSIFGGDSLIDQLLVLSNRSEDLMRASEAIAKIGPAFKSLQSLDAFKGLKFNIKAFSEDLLQASHNI